MNNINEVCKENSAYKFRPQTDIIFKLPDGAFKYTGVLDEAIKHIENIQLLRSDLWKQFVEQYRIHPDDDTYAWRGEYWGKMMRGACFTYQYTQNEELYKVLSDSIKDLMSTQDSLGRISTYSVEKEFDGWDLWCRKYVLLGFQYFLDICRDDNFAKEITECMCRAADYIMDKVGYEKDGKKLITLCTRHWFGLNSSSILEPYVRLYNITGEMKYFDFATYIVDCGGVSNGNIWQAAIEDNLMPFEYPTNKAYEMMSCFEGLLEYYRVTKEEKYKIAVVNYAKKVIESDITIIGCSGCIHELFDNSAKTQTRTDNFNVMQETCVTVTWMKFCHQLLCLTGDADFADAIELSTYNAMLGAVNDYNSKMLNGFAFDSYSPLFMDVRSRQSGGYQPMDGDVDSYGCCACIGSAGTALMGLASVMQSHKGFNFNLYIPGNVSVKTPNGTDINFKIDTEYPVKEQINIFIQKATGEEEFTIALRIPKWCDGATLNVCGEDVKVCTKGYIELTRKWACCDKITLTLPMPMKVILPPCGGGDENGATLVALKKGPVTFARDARLGQSIDSLVDFDMDENGIVKVEQAHAPFKSMAAYNVYNKDGSFITVVDYQSAGKTWNYESAMTAWMPTKNYWTADLTKPVILDNNMNDLGITSDGNFLTPTRGVRNRGIFLFEDKGDGCYYIKETTTGLYVTAEKHNVLDRYYLTLCEKGAENQGWKLEHAYINKYRLYSETLPGAVAHAIYNHDIFILADTKANDCIQGHCYTNNTFVCIRNVK